jgi:hypothetical protein
LVGAQARCALATLKSLPSRGKSTIEKWAEAAVAKAVLLAPASHSHAKFATGCLKKSRHIPASERI